ncbi:hypothetical protein R1flu_017924 [Riccia fluitans]|uniref:Ubiquitin-like protease family profile domain-containing protein n=1 Tax=Riccia fluitans TaxID=41844 RepID=A0ABD1ZFQ7_9MARC
MLSNILEHHGRANQHLAFLEEDLVHAKREEEKLKATIEAHEREKRKMNAKVALIEMKDLYELLEAKMEGFQIANHPRTIGGFENFNLTITKNGWRFPRSTWRSLRDVLRTLRKIHDEDMQQSLPAWIFVPIHGNNHWSLAIIRIINNDAMLAHLDSFQGIHDPEAIFHVLRTFLCLTMPIDPALVQTVIMNLDQQKDGHSCGKHVLQMLAGAGMKGSGLDRCFWEEGLRSIATLDQHRYMDQYMSWLIAQVIHES